MIMFRYRLFARAFLLALRERRLRLSMKIENAIAA